MAPKGRLGSRSSVYGGLARPETNRVSRAEINQAIHAELRFPPSLRAAPRPGCVPYRTDKLCLSLLDSLLDHLLLIRKKETYGALRRFIYGCPP